MLKRLLSLVCGICLLWSIAGCARKNGQGGLQSTESLPAEKSVREGIRTVLAVSLKAFEPNESGGFRNESQADMLMLMVIDEGRRQTTAVQINPDTMVSFSPSGTTEARQIPLLDDGEKSGHGGGDYGLVRDFLEVVRCGGESRSSARASLQSHLICFAAERSRLSHTVEELRL